MRKILIIFLAIAVSLPVVAQKSRKDKKEERRQRINALIKQEEEGVIAYRKHSAFGAKLSSDEYGGFFEIGRAQSIKKSLLFQLEITERKSPKEEKQSHPFFPTVPFIYGKINFFYPVKLGVQQQILLGNKGNKNGISVTGNFGGGITLGLLRPYYLEVDDSTGTGRIDIKYESADSNLFVSNVDLVNRQVAGPGFGKGWNGLKLTPGAYAKVSLRFDYGRYNEVLSALEVGVTAEIYAKKIPQVVFTTPKQFFFNAYVALVFGKRK